MLEEEWWSELPSDLTNGEQLETERLKTESIHTIIWSSH